MRTRTSTGATTLPLASNASAACATRGYNLSSRYVSTLTWALGFMLRLLIAHRCKSNLRAANLCPYLPRHATKTVFYRVVQEHIETYLCLCAEGTWDGSTVPFYVERDFRRYLEMLHSGSWFRRGALLVMWP